MSRICGACLQELPAEALECSCGRTWSKPLTEVPAPRSAGRQWFSSRTVVILLLTFMGFAGIGLIVGFLYVREEILKSNTTVNLKTISVLIHHYHDEHERFPGANAPLIDANGVESPHPVSWRVAILNFSDHKPLYDSYRFDEPWDGPNNSELLKKMPREFRSPKARSVGTPEGYTHYRVLISKPGVKPGALFTDGKPGTVLYRFKDSPNLTLMVVETAEAVPWTKPEGILFDQDQPLPKLGGLHAGGFHAVFADGRTSFLRDNTSPDLLRAMITRNGGEPSTSW